MDMYHIWWGTNRCLVRGIGIIRGWFAMLRLGKRRIVQTISPLFSWFRIQKFKREGPSKLAVGRFGRDFIQSFKNLWITSIRRFGRRMRCGWFLDLEAETILNYMGWHQSHTNAMKTVIKAAWSYPPQWSIAKIILLDPVRVVELVYISETV